MLKNMKIRRKLIIGFLLIGFFSLAVGAMGLVNMDKANTSTLNLYEQEMMPSSYLQTVQKNLISIGSNYVLMLYEQNASKAQLRVNEITAWTLEDKQLLLLYEASALTDEEKEIYTRLQMYDKQKEVNARLQGK